MKITLITNSPNAYGNRELMAYSAKLGLKLSMISSSEFLERTLENTVYLQRNTGIDYSDEDLDKLEKAIFVINQCQYHRILRDKFKQYLYFQSLGIPLISSQLITDLDKSKLDKNKKYVLKTLRGNGGRGVTLNLSADDLISKKEELLLRNDLDYLFQEMMTFQSEYRFLSIFNNEFLAKKVIKRAKGNLLDGVRLDPIEIFPDDMRQVIELIKSEMNLAIYACDFVRNLNGELLVIEVNSCPGFELIDQAYETSCANLILKCLKDEDILSTFI